MNSFDCNLQFEDFYDDIQEEWLVILEEEDING